MVADVCHWEFKVQKDDTNAMGRWYYDIECGREDKLRMFVGSVDWVGKEPYYTYSFCPFCGKPLEKMFGNEKNWAV